MTAGVPDAEDGTAGSVWPLPADLGAVVALVVLANAAVFLPVVNDSPVRIVLGLPFVLVLPGYAVVAALFPERGPATDAGADTDTAETPIRGIDGIERAALSVAVSIPVVALLGLGLSLTQ